MKLTHDIILLFSPLGFAFFYQQQYMYRNFTLNRVLPQSPVLLDNFRDNRRSPDYNFIVLFNNFKAAGDRLRYGTILGTTGDRSKMRFKHVPGLHSKKRVICTHASIFACENGHVIRRVHNTRSRNAFKVKLLMELSTNRCI